MLIVGEGSFPTTRYFWIWCPRLPGDLSRCVAWIHADQAKNHKPLGVPLNAEAVTVLHRRQGRHPRYVFTYRHHAPVVCVNGESWREGARRAGLKNFRWHDLRHTWASWHAQAGTPGITR